MSTITIGSHVQVLPTDSAFHGMTGRVLAIRTAPFSQEPDDFLSVSVIFPDETCALLRGKRIKWSPYELAVLA